AEGELTEVEGAAGTGDREDVIGRAVGDRDRDIVSGRKALVVAVASPGGAEAADLQRGREGDDEAVALLDLARRAGGPILQLDVAHRRSGRGRTVHGVHRPGDTAV